MVKKKTNGRKGTETEFVWVLTLFNRDFEVINYVNRSKEKCVDRVKELMDGSQIPIWDEIKAALLKYEHYEDEDIGEIYEINMCPVHG